MTGLSLVVRISSFLFFSGFIVAALFPRTVRLGLGLTLIFFCLFILNGAAQNFTALDFCLLLVNSRSPQASFLWESLSAGGQGLGALVSEAAIGITLGVVCGVSAYAAHLLGAWISGFLFEADRCAEEPWQGMPLGLRNQISSLVLLLLLAVGFASSLGSSLFAFVGESIITPFIDPNLAVDLSSLSYKSLLGVGVLSLKTALVLALPMIVLSLCVDFSLFVSSRYFVFIGDRTILDSVRIPVLILALVLCIYSITSGFTVLIEQSFDPQNADRLFEAAAQQGG